ncbi:hypothetical protein [Streptomyces coelicoflavus]|uniref:hypothetical protein n=1 Tax=Streptomyces coelicoflavus TaxID=285562 RepID=UPI0002FFD812|nr:hypothetical protein [Streptomyces coelicoflavus]MZE42381.1 hypothetical protein [Streptomyces sp. SID5477]
MVREIVNEVRATLQERNVRRRPCFSLPKGRKSREVPLPTLPALAEADHGRPDPQLVARQVDSPVPRQNIIEC